MQQGGNRFVAWRHQGMKRSRDFGKNSGESLGEKRNSYVMKRGRSRCCLHVCLISLKWASWSEVRNLLKAAAHPQSLCLDVQELFGSYHHHTHGQGRPRSPIRQRQCNYNCLQNTRQRLLPVLDIPRAALATTSDATKIKANFNRRWMSNRPIP